MRDSSRGTMGSNDNAPYPRVRGVVCHGARSYAGALFRPGSTRC